jgi:PAS domain S-box-containing protein
MDPVDSSQTSANTRNGLLKHAEGVLRRSAERQAFLLKLSDALRPLSDPTAVQEAACRVLGEHIGASRAYYVEVEPDETHVVTANDYTNGVPSVSGRYRIDDFAPFVLAEYRAGRTVIITDTTTDRRIPDAAREAWAAVGITAQAAVPLVKEGRFVAALGVDQDRPRQWTPEEIALLEETAERTWAAVERARSDHALRESEDKYRALFDSMDEGYCIIEVIFDEAGRPVDYLFIEVNSAFERQAGMTEAVGRRMLEFVPSIERHWLENYGQVARTGVPVRFANEYKGLNKWFDVYAFRHEAWPGTRIAVLFTDITARMRAEAQLLEAHAELESRVEQRTHELAEANRALSDEIEERKTLEQTRVELIRRIVTSQEEERRRMSRDLHDQLGQQMTVLRLKLMNLSQSAEGHDGFAAHVREVQQIADRLDTELSFLSSQLRPTALDDLGLENALRAYTAEWSRHTGIPLEFHSNLAPEERVDPEVETQLYRIAQEALNNTAKHAHATQVAVLLEQSRDAIRLIIEDDGQGFDTTTNPQPTNSKAHNLGLLNMTERANLVGGNIQIESTKGQGTTILTKMPRLNRSSSSQPSNNVGDARVV